jgi:transcriptional regulator with XRE-family HTH domain
MNCYKRIKNLREDNDLTQSQVGEKINIPQRTYAYYESGERTIPPHVLISIARFYKTSVDYLLGLTDEKKPYPKSKD